MISKTKKIETWLQNDLGCERKMYFKKEFKLICQNVNSVCFRIFSYFFPVSTHYEFSEYVLLFIIKGNDTLKINTEKDRYQI